MIMNLSIDMYFMLSSLYKICIYLIFQNSCRFQISIWIKSLSKCTAFKVSDFHKMIQGDWIQIILTTLQSVHFPKLQKCTGWLLSERVWSVGIESSQETVFCLHLGYKFLNIFANISKKINSCVYLHVWDCLRNRDSLFAGFSSQLINIQLGLLQNSHLSRNFWTY